MYLVPCHQKEVALMINGIYVIMLDQNWNWETYLLRANFRPPDIYLEVSDHCRLPEGCMMDPAMCENKVSLFPLMSNLIDLINIHLCFDVTWHLKLTFPSLMVL